MQTKTRPTFLNNKYIDVKPAAMCLIIFLAVFFSFPGAFAVSISNSPMETKVQAAAPNIMFILDDSGSMDWEFMTTETDGLFDGEYYVFDNPGDNNPDYSDYKILDSTQRKKWKSQWYGYNRIYYNPHVNYRPWPGMPNADTATPRSNPNNATHTLNLSAAYMTIAESPVLIDNGDGEPRFSQTGVWPDPYGYSDAYNGSYLYTDDTSATATWTAQDLEPGSYNVYAIWFSSNTRDTAAEFVITHQDGETIVTRDQSINLETWVSLGDYNFGSTGSVTLQSSCTATNCRRCADAVKFVPATSDLEVKNAHYFMLDENTDEVYLVNFDEGIRSFYQIDLEGDSVSGFTEILTPPDSIRAKIYDEDQEIIRYMTDAEELQNFANWYSFYRRRELTAKAAVSSIISSLKGVNLGFYSLNSTSTVGLRQPVLPVKLNDAHRIILNNGDSNYAETGYWENSGSSNSFDNDARYTSSTGAKATWTPNIPKEGTYKVYTWWNCYNYRDERAKYTVNHSTGQAEMEKDQSDAATCGQWQLLGTYHFNQGTGGWVSVERHGGSNGNSTCADAVMFESEDEVEFADETNTLLNALYSLDSRGNTPLMGALDNVGKYFDASSSSDGNLGASPYGLEAKGGACQHSFGILMTDGFYNDSVSDYGNVDGTKGAPYADSYSNTLADIAMYYYDTDLVESLPDMVPSSSCDKNQAQHMVTYSVSFGVTGTLTPSEDDPCFLNPDTPQPTWPSPGTNSGKIDDLYHAAVNGRGEFFSAANPEELVASLEDLFENIASRSASGASVSVNGEELGSETTLYQAVYNADGWTGDIYAYPMDPDSGEILKTASDIKWQASGKPGDPNGLQALNWDTDRKIITFNTVFNANGSAQPFRASYLSDAQKTALDSGWETDTAVPTKVQNLMEYLRGKEITGFRLRNQRLGDIVHSAPLLEGSAIYAGANDGMLHAFDKDTGREIFAYIPNLVFENLKYLSDLDYNNNHRFYVDNTAASQFHGQISTDIQDILVCGLGAGGKGYFALDITDVETYTKTTTEATIANQIGLWEFPGVGNTDVDLGLSFSAAHVVKTNYDDKWVVIFGNGYNSTNGSAVLFILDAVTGEEITRIDTGVSGGNGLSSPVVIDVNNDFKADYVYAGDLKGNLWKFDLTSSNFNEWEVAYIKEGAPQPLFQAGVGQPITARPDVMRHPTEHGYIVVFGTGQFLDDADRTVPIGYQQSVYGIWDYGDDGTDEYIGILDHATGDLNHPLYEPDGVSLVKQVVVDTKTTGGSLYRTLSNNPVEYRFTVDGDEQELPADNDPLDGKPDPVKHAGWFFDFPNDGVDGEYEGERVIKDVTIRDGMVFVLSFIPKSSPCTGGGNSFFYILDPATGGRFETPVIDVNGDGIVNADDLITIEVDGETITAAPTGKLNIGMLHVPKFVKLNNNVDKVIMSDSSGDIPTEDIKGESLGMYYWLER